ncbi:MAG: DUF5522 domain-containing protein [Acidobacteriaceae bacterium]|nr:DUF5522 domain-containing protein [Acidobacteriaceae bacterium]MDE1154855.1 DUF5522 domain-containing protein [Acidobacteriaceae bacterium]
MSEAKKPDEHAAVPESRAAFDAFELLEGDLYWENGLVVFTEQYHLRRGFCCNSDCRHCPYR